MAEVISLPKERPEDAALESILGFLGVSKNLGYLILGSL